MQKHRLTIALDAVPGLPDAGLSIAADLCWQGEPAADAAVLLCFPGGGVHRQYFDMRPSGDASYSFAEALTSAGAVVVLIDHLGVGDSARPADGFALTAEVVAAGNAMATTGILARLRTGAAAAGLAKLPDLLPRLVA